MEEMEHSLCSEILHDETDIQEVAAALDIAGQAIDEMTEAAEKLLAVPRIRCKRGVIVTADLRASVGKVAQTTEEALRLSGLAIGLIHTRGLVDILGADKLKSLEVRTASCKLLYDHFLTASKPVLASATIQYAPPCLATFLLACVLPIERQEEVLGHFDELYALKLSRFTGTPLLAKLWYWHQAAVSSWPYIKRNLLKLMLTEEIWRRFR